MRMRRLHKDERGIAAVVVAIVLVALIGAAVITVDAGNVRSTRRGIITGTDASVLDAAQMFNCFLDAECSADADRAKADPCDAATNPGVAEGAWGVANNHATNVLWKNHPEGEHDLTDPLQFTVEVLDPSQCGVAGGYTPGKAYYEGRLEAEGFFSGIFGFGNTKPLSTSTAAWGYIQSIGEGLRPFSVCDQDEQFQHYLAYWQALHDGDPTNDESARITYDGRYGTDQGTTLGGLPGDGDVDPTDGVTPNAMSDQDADGDGDFGIYPWKSMGYPPGEADPPPDQKSNPNFAETYTPPSASTTDNVFHPVVRVVTPDPNSGCGHAKGNRGWVDLRGAGDTGSPGVNDVRDWLLNGYPGEVSLSPQPDCDPTEDGSPEACGAQPGTADALMTALHELTCDVATAALKCEYVFPILVVKCIGRIEPSTGDCVQDSSTGGENAEYVHTAFIFIVLRGYGKIANSAQPECSESNCSGANAKGVLALDMEIVDVQTSGEVGGAPPPAPGGFYITGTQLCGADHADNHCPF